MSYITEAIPPLRFLGTEALTATNNTTLGSVNTVFLYLFKTDTPITILTANWRTGTTATGHVNMGIYTFAGNIVAGSDTGAIANTVSANKVFTYASPFTIGPGTYWMAYADDNGTDTYAAIPGLANAEVTSRLRTATNALAAGALPLTTGAFASNVAAKILCCSFGLSGGL